MTKSNILIPSSTAYAFLNSLESIIGKVGVTAVLRYSGQTQYIDNYPANDDEPSIDLADIAAIHAGIETLYGWRGGKALIMNAGRETWKGFISTLTAYPTQDVLDNLHSIPVEERIIPTLNFVSVVFNPYQEHKIEIVDLGDAVLYQTKVCPSCWGRKMQKPGCHLTAGYIQESIRWATDKLYSIEQTTCIGCGDDLCSFKVSKNITE